MGIRMAHYMGLSPRAQANIERVKSQSNGHVHAFPSGDTYEGVQLQKYLLLADDEHEMVEWFDHMIAEFQDRKAKFLAGIPGEMFREYLQEVMYTDAGPMYFLGLKNEIHIMRDMDWTQEEMDES
jgi:hypothetical protein